MAVKEFLQWVIENREYVPLYSSMISTGAFIFSIISFFYSNHVSKKRVEKEKEISAARYEEQKRQYEERLYEARRQREEDKYEADEKLRISEQPYFVLKTSEILPGLNSEQIILRLEFLNKGRGAAYEINPDIKCEAMKMDMSKFEMMRCEAIQDLIVRVGETFSVSMSYYKKENKIFRLTLKITFEDSSGREYRQIHEIDVYENGNAIVINYAKPDYIKEN